MAYISLGDSIAKQNPHAKIIYAIINALVVYMIPQFNAFAIITFLVNFIIYILFRRENNMYRAVDITFWDDPKVADAFTPQERYFMLYLITNNHTNSTGCYGLSIRRAASETGYDESQICDLLERMEKVYNVIRFSEQTREVFVLNFHKYNWNRSPKTLKSIRTQAVGINFNSRTYVRCDQII